MKLFESHKETHELIHTDFKHFEGGWYGNKSFLGKYNDLDHNRPAMLTYHFKFDDDNIKRGMIDDEKCPFPVEIKRIGEDSYQGVAYSDEPEDVAIQSWIYHYTRKDTNEQRVAA